MSGHAVLAPSSAPQWGYCSGSVVAQQGIPDPDSQKSREGTAAHWAFAETMINNDADTSVYLGRTDPDGTVITEEMVEGAQVIVDDIRDVMAAHPGGQLRIEHGVFMPQIHPEHNWGTLDASYTYGNVIVIWDYKHGHYVVDAEGNLQSIDYIAGLVNELQIDGHADQYISVDMRIVQPFAYKQAGPIDAWRGALCDLRPYFNQLTYKAAEALSGNATLTTGKHCTHCRAVGRCGMAKAAGYNLIDVVNGAYQMDDMDGQALALEHRILSAGLAALKGRIGALADTLADRISRGDSSTGLAIGTVPGRKVWTASNGQVIALAKQFGADVSKEDVLTPKQAEAKVDKTMRVHYLTAIKAITTRKAGKLTLIKAENSVSHLAFKKG